MAPGRAHPHVHRHGSTDCREHADFHGRVGGASSNGSTPSWVCSVSTAFSCALPLWQRGGSLISVTEPHDSQRQTLTSRGTLWGLASYGLGGFACAMGSSLPRKAWHTCAPFSSVCHCRGQRDGRILVCPMEGEQRSSSRPLWRTVPHYLKGECPHGYDTRGGTPSATEGGRRSVLRRDGQEGHVARAMGRRCRPAFAARSRRSRHPIDGARSGPCLVCVAVSCARSHAYHRTLFQRGLDGHRLAVGCWDYASTLHAACGGPLHGQRRWQDYAAGKPL